MSIFLPLSWEAILAAVAAGFVIGGIVFGNLPKRWLATTNHSLKSYLSSHGFYTAIFGSALAAALLVAILNNGITSYVNGMLLGIAFFVGVFAANRALKART